ncbi:MAG: hypothetical protein ACREMY_07625 [bacterium]
MNRATAGLAILAGLTLLMLTFGGVCFTAGAAYLALAEHMSPWLAALLTGGVMLLPLLTAVGWLLWQARERRLRKLRHAHFDSLRAAFAEKARTRPYAFMGEAFMSGMMLATAAPFTKERMAEVVAAFRENQSCD